MRRRARAEAGLRSCAAQCAAGSVMLRFPVVFDVHLALAVAQAWDPDKCHCF